MTCELCMTKASVFYRDRLGVERSLCALHADEYEERRALHGVESGRDLGIDSFIYGRPRPQEHNPALDAMRDAAAKGLTKEMFDVT